MNTKLTLETNNDTITIFLCLLKNFMRYRVAMEFIDVMWRNHFFIPTNNHILMKYVMVIVARDISEAWKENNEPVIKFLESMVSWNKARRRRKGE